jgi:membrane-associated protein
MAAFVEDVLNSVPVWVVYLTVFALPFLEASIFLGFVIPGETALVFGGVLAGRPESAGHPHPSLAVVLVLAIVGAITGDGVGYGVGRRYGTGLQASRLGQKVGDARWQTTEAFLLRRGGPAVFFGRFTALLRALVPGAAGMAKLPYKTFALWNAVGGAFWATACVLGGYAVGDVIGSYLSDLGYVIVGLVVLAAAVHFGRGHRSKKKAATSDLSGS